MTNNNPVTVIRSSTLYCIQSNLNRCYSCWYVYWWSMLSSSRSANTGGYEVVIILLPLSAISHLFIRSLSVQQLHSSTEQKDHTFNAAASHCGKRWDRLKRRVLQCLTLLCRSAHVHFLSLCAADRQQRGADQIITMPSAVTTQPRLNV